MWITADFIPISSRNIVSVYVVTVKQKILNGRLCTPAVFYLPVPSIHLTLFLFENSISLGGVSVPIQSPIAVYYFYLVDDLSQSVL
jgi:hypothetical protein